MSHPAGQFSVQVDAGTWLEADEAVTGLASSGQRRLIAGWIARHSDPAA
jgi:hypothetical protein